MSGIDRQTSLLQERRFWPLFCVQALGAFNDQVFKTGFVALLTYRLADEMGLDIGFHNLLAAALFIIPFALFAPTAGQIADGVDKAKMMRWVKAAEIVLMGLAAIAYFHTNLTMLYVLLFLMGGQSAVFSPVKYGVLPQYLKPEELVAGNGLIQGATFLAILTGQIIGTNLVRSDAGILFISIAIISVAVLGFIASLFAPPAPAPGPAPKVDWMLPRAMWQTIANARRIKPAWKALLGIGWFWFVASIFLTMVFPFAKETLAADESVATLLLAAFSIGAALGSFLSNRIYRGEVNMAIAPWGAIGIAAFGTLLYLCASLYQRPPEGLQDAGAFLGNGLSWAVLITFTGLAICAGFYITPQNVQLQVSAPAGERGRFIACSNLIDALLMALSSVIGMLLLLLGLSHTDILLLFALTGMGAALWLARQAPTSFLGRIAGMLMPES